MTINLRSVASLGIGFGAAAVAGIGLVAVIATQSVDQSVDSTALFTPNEVATVVSSTTQQSAVRLPLALTNVTSLRAETYLLSVAAPSPSTAVTTSQQSTSMHLTAAWTTYLSARSESAAFLAAGYGSVLTIQPNSTAQVNMNTAQQTAVRVVLPTSYITQIEDDVYYLGEQA